VIQARAFLGSGGLSTQKGLIKLISPDDEGEMESEWKKAAEWFTWITAELDEYPLEFDIIVGGTDDQPMSGAVMSDPMQPGNTYVGVEIVSGGVRFLRVGIVEELDGELQIGTFEIPARLIEAGIKLNISPFFLTTSEDPDEIKEKMHLAHEVFIEAGPDGLMQLISNPDDDQDIRDSSDQADTRPVIGIDIGKGRWACAAIDLDCDSSDLSIDLFPVPVGELDPDAYSLLVIDCPVGLLADEESNPTPKGVSGDRPVDKGARKWVGSTVFPAPTQEQLKRSLELIDDGVTAPTSEELPGGLSRQGYSLTPYIRDAHRMKDLRSEGLFESHPEVAFLVAAGRRERFPAGKKQREGQQARAEVVDRCLGIDSLALAAEARSKHGIPVDDWLDALMMAIVAVDWLDSSNRHAITSRDGEVRAWTGELDRIMAMPRART